MYTPPARILVEYLQRLYDFGMTTTSGGNLSIREPDGVVWVTPGSIDKGSLRPADIVKVLPGGREVGCHKPSCELPFHQHIYRVRPDVGAVLHAHVPALVAMSCVRRVPNLQLVPGAEAVCGRVEFARYAVPGSERLGNILATQIRKGADCLIMENHGAVVVGRDMAQCFRRMEALDRAARLELAATGLGEPRPALSGRAARWPTFKPDAPGSAECELRETLARFHARAYRQRLFHTGNAFIAARLGADDFLVSPENLDPLLATAADFVRVAAGRREAGKTPAAPAALAREIFRAHDWVSSVYQTRAESILAFASSGAPFDSRTIPESYIQLRDVPVVSAAEYDANPAAVAARLSRRNPVLLIESTGLVTVGETILQGFDRMEVGEFTAKCLLMAQRLGTLSPMTQRQVDEVIDDFGLPR